mgnify:CR=1 FL=1
MNAIQKIERKQLKGIGQIPVCKITDWENQIDKYYNIGVQEILKGKLALVLLAGGQGTRLGLDGPKGTLNVGITKKLYLFELLIKNTLKVVEKIGCLIPFFIMTSELNDIETRAFFETHDYFGYNPNYIRFFIQESNVVTDLAGEPLYKAPGERMTSPNGNGGWFSSLYNSNIVKDSLFNRVEWINVFSVDNVLQGIADPVFLGATINSGDICGAKVIKKSYPEERVGAICTLNGKPYIIEYYELDELKKDNPALDMCMFNYGVTLNYLFRVSELEKTLNVDMPLHKVKKNVKRYYKNGKYHESMELNAYKYETLALDLIHMMDSCMVFEIEREKEFAPIKNKEGTDSLETARMLLQKNGWNL